jgi:leucyl/phenylalanyl-tRNA--protein transferase
MEVGFPIDRRIAHACRPPLRIAAETPRAMIRIPILRSENDAFPDPRTALDEPNGLLAAGGDLSVTRLLDAYARGIFPWFSEDQPILWWSPSRRTVFDTDAMHVPRRLARWLRKCNWRIRSDTAFIDVVRACAAPRRHERGTWITDGMLAAYGELHALGHAHSVEVWDGDALVGGLYGVSIGAAFFGESMFHRKTDCSKIAMAHLIARLRAGRYRLLDTQFVTDHLKTFGGIEIPREDYELRLADALGHESDWRAIDNRAPAEAL